NISELASNGTHEGTNRYEYGDVDLKSETSFQLDAGLELNYEHFNISVSAFYNSINNFIFYRKLESVFGGDSLVNVNGDDITAFKFSQQDAMLTGVEATFDIHPHPLDWLHFENNFSFVRGTFKNGIDNSKNLPMIPAARWVSELRANFNKAGKSFSNLYVKLEADNMFDQDKAFTGYNTETSTKGYTLLNAGLGSDILGKNKKTLLSVYLALNNLTDKAYQNHLSRLKYAAENMVTGRTGVFNMGRNFSIKLNIPLEFSWK
ncbi:MAG TPA: TonB-dependent receptor, partial [Chitinophagaceae bacterium]